jgi:hypothetical protein
MREDFEEQISKMFPKGYLLVYVVPNGDVRCNMFNPEGYAGIHKLKQIVEQGWEKP